MQPVIFTVILKLRTSQGNSYSYTLMSGTV